MDFEPTDRCKELLEQVRGFMAEHVYPDERRGRSRRSIARSTRDTPFPADPRRPARQREGRRPVEPLPAQRTTTARASRTSSTGSICEEMGRCTLVAPYVFNCQPPDSGNMEILAEHATAAPARALAGAAARGRDPQLLLDDRARHRRLGPDRPLLPRGARRRRVGDQRPQVVDDQRARRRGRDRDGGHRPRRRPHQRATMLLVPDGHARLQPGPPAVEHGPQPRAPGTGRSPTRTAASRSRTARSASARAASRSPRTGSGPGASTTACG